MSQADINVPGSLGSAFGGSAAGLGSMLPPKPPASAPPPSTPERVDRRAEVPDTDTREQAAAVVETGPRTVAEQDEESYTYAVGVYLLPAAISAAAKRRTAEAVDNARIAYDAIDVLRGRLSELVAARQSEPRPEGSLFPGRRQSAQAAAQAAGRRRLWSLQATAAELAILDQLQTASGARSRSELISCAMEAYLLPRRRGRAR